MTFVDFENSPDVDSKCPCQFFVRIENLPWSVTPPDVKAFFHGLDILPGGISILGRNAFVSFERWVDMSAAMRRDGHVFGGQKLFLSIVDLKKVRMINDQHIQRSLHFLSLIGGRRKNVVETDSETFDRQKKIRPTAIRDDLTTSNSAFVPEEIDSRTKDMHCAVPVIKPVVNCRRRIKPTPLKRAYQRTISSPSPFQTDEKWKRLIYG